MESPSARKNRAYIQYLEEWTQSNLEWAATRQPITEDQQALMDALIRDAEERFKDATYEEVLAVNLDIAHRGLQAFEKYYESWIDPLDRGAE